MKTLPNELLSHIFSSSATECIHNAVVASHVCKSWRSVSLSTSRLWNTISMTRDTPLLQVAACIRRSRNQPLDIFMDFRDPDWEWEEDNHSFGWEDMQLMVRLLIPAVARWRTVELLCDTWKPIYVFLQYTKNVTSAPLLETLALSRCNAYFAGAGQMFAPAKLKAPIGLFNNGAAFSRLCKVTLAGVHVDWAQSGLAGLTELELKYHASEVMPTIDEFVEILNSCPDLEHLSILGWGPKMDASCSSKVKEPPTSVTIVLPRLTRFTFGFVDVAYAVELCSMLDLPALNVLSIEDISSSLDPESPPLDASSLLKFMTSKTTKTGHESTPRFPLASLRSLHLIAVCGSSASLVGLLSQCTLLKELSLIDTSNTALHALRSVDSCPTLADLTCRRVDSAALVETVKEREKTESPLRRVLVNNEGGGLGEGEEALLREAGVRLLFDEVSTEEEDRGGELDDDVFCVSTVVVECV